MKAKEYRLTCTKNEMQSIKVMTPRDAYDFATNFFSDDIDIYESCFIILTDKANRIIGWYKVSSGGLDATTSVQVTENCGFKLEYLVKMAKVMEHIGTDVLMVNADGRRASLASTDMGKALLMPIMGYEDAEFRYKL